jgi:hypothetical protein
VVLRRNQHCMPTHLPQLLEQRGLPFGAETWSGVEWQILRVCVEEEPYL